LAVEAATELQVIEQNVARMVWIAVANVPAVVAFELTLVAVGVLARVRVIGR